MGNINNLQKSLEKELTDNLHVMLEIVKYYKNIAEMTGHQERLTPYLHDKAVPVRLI